MRNGCSNSLALLGTGSSGPLALWERVRVRASGLLCCNSGYDVVRVFMAVVLLVAAGLKTHQLATEPTLGTSLLETRWFLMAEVEFEIFFGIWLLSNTLPKLTWLAVLGCFGVFTCVSLSKALSGAASCGCFGRVHVNPWYTTCLDASIVLSLLYWRPRPLPSPFGRGAGGEGVSGMSPLLSEKGWGEGSPLPPSLFRLPPSIVAVLALWLLLGLPAAYAMGGYVDTTLSDAGEIIGNGKIVVLEPQKWVGKRFPLLGHIDVGNKLTSGLWLVLLHRHDCSACREAASQYEAGKGLLDETELSYNRLDRMSALRTECENDSGEFYGQRAYGRWARVAAFRSNECTDRRRPGAECVHERS